ncbi:MULTISPECIES: hypothetical protein [unclassified Streptomyces]|nr:hypothetical protein [Streptomyces sp. NBC_01221]MCX4794349.1 hypothetical protein [Streptomyces sp. NBC_01242]WSP58200.1 hypothetical protein OG306_30320 [Streptomyces sp. NBC_01241]WSP62160.1 hypothetical protein OG466_09815 [Streptomyces sp. NBC_01240]
MSATYGVTVAQLRERLSVDLLPRATDTKRRTRADVIHGSAP